MSKLTVTWVESTRVYRVPGMSGCPSIVKVAEPVDPGGPPSKFVPTRLKLTFESLAWLDGVAEVSVGAAFTVKQPAHDPAPKSGFVTVMSCAPRVADPETVMFTVRWILESRATVFTVMPVPLNATVGVVSNPVP